MDWTIGQVVIVNTQLKTNHLHPPLLLLFQFASSFQNSRHPTLFLFIQDIDILAPFS